MADAQVALSRVKAGALVRAGAVLVNGRIVRKPAHLLHPGDRVAVTADGARASEDHVTPHDLQLKILYEDDACLVIEKPAGIAMHPASGLKKDEPTILHGIAALFAKKHLPFAASSVLVHRLDRDTTGCLLIAKTPQAHAALQKQFKDRTIGKTYLAIVAGVPAEREAHIDAPIGRHVNQRTKMSVLGAAAARGAQTTYRVLSASADAALLACDLHTGRTHQIRVHMSAIGHPVIGDAAYASSESLQLAEQKRISGLCLHAWRLTFDSPATHDRIAVLCSPPRTLRAAAKAFALSIPREEG